MNFGLKRCLKLIDKGNPLVVVKVIFSEI